jgi:hypothetical protein
MPDAIAAQNEPKRESARDQSMDAWFGQGNTAQGAHKALFWTLRRFLERRVDVEGDVENLVLCVCSLLVDARLFLFNRVFIELVFAIMQSSSILMTNHLGGVFS